jgi:ribosomal protein L15
VPHRALRAKVILPARSSASRAEGHRVSKGARAAIEAAGGSVELPETKAPAGKLQKKAPAAEAKA